MFKKKTADHEQLVGTSSYLQVVRQDRYDSNGKVRLKCSDGLFEVKNYSLFGLAVSSKIDLPIGHIVNESQLLLNDEVIGDFALVLKRKQSEGDGYNYGFECITESIPVVRIQQIEEIQKSVGSLRERSEKMDRLPIEFRCNVQELRGRLKKFEDIVHSFENRAHHDKIERETTYNLVIESIGKEIFDDISKTNLKLQKIVEHAPEENLKLSFTYFKETVGEFIYQSPFMKRSFEKPRGYAGDFEMMSQIYNNDNFAHDLFGSVMERAIQLHAEPTAVRNRSIYLADKIISTIQSRKGDVSILAVACGPAEEVKKVIRTLGQVELDRVTFFLLDQDEEALKYAQKNIKSEALQSGKKVQINLLNQGIKEVILKGLHDDSHDLIYSAGLFDYFSDPVAARAGKALSAALKPGGNLVIGNFNITAPNWFGMLTLFDWHLILRGANDLTRIFTYEGFRLSIEAEPENVNLFCNIKRE